jgi:CDGSH-type Zn-finger protein
MHIGKRDPYTDGAHGIRQRDPYTDGAHGIRERDPYTDGAHGSAGMNLAGLDRTGVSAPPAHSA